MKIYSVEEDNFISDVQKGVNIQNIQRTHKMPTTEGKNQIFKCLRI